MNTIHELEPGTVVAGRYRVIRRLGRGATADVYVAESIPTARQVAIKLLQSGARSIPSIVQRFRREARATAFIRSEHVPQVLDVEDDSEHGIVIVFDLLSGESLLDRL